MAYNGGSFQWQPHPHSANQGAYLLGTIALGIFAVVMIGLFLSNGREIAQYRRDCAGFSWSGGPAGGVCYAESADERIAIYHGKSGSSNYLKLSSVTRADEAVELPQGFDWRSIPEYTSCQIQRWRDNVPLVRIGDRVIETKENPEQESPTFDIVSAILLAAMAICCGLLAARSIRVFEKREADLYSRTQDDS